MPRVTLNKDGRITLPASVRQNLKLKAGDKVKFDADKVNGQLTVTKIEKTK